ncbi:hypothetical protein LBMAG53_15270 [Planctomycetota bacterium]|nr:hypothetical protein LBMAG53_15270 [Planctomycetota bacterium]
MDFPLFHLAYFGDRTLIAVIAILHVLINHAFAVGFIPLVVVLERQAAARGDAAGDALAKRFMGVAFVLTTTIGALTGVGIWLSTALINPEAIGSLLRVFFWAWFTEWLVFISEVALILAYYLTWDQWTGPRKAAHIRLGWTLAAFSWITMAIIVAILGFMLTPGSWASERGLFSGLLNPTYLPQLAFRTPLALAMAGCVGLALSVLFTERDSDLRHRTVRFCGLWTLVFLPFAAAGLVWWWASVPADLAQNLATALATQQAAAQSYVVLWTLLGLAGIVVAVAALAVIAPRRIGLTLAVIALVATCLELGWFERTREFLRKPWSVPGYLYANRFRAEDYPMLQRDGILAHAAWSPVRQVTAGNRLVAGRTVFDLACATCHTVDGLNGMRAILRTMYGPPPWDADAIAAYIATIHDSRFYMPPFPGNDTEREALGAWLAALGSPLTVAGKAP